MTVEQLADYIQSNKIKVENHTEKFILTEEERTTLAMKSYNASSAITRLENLKKDISAIIMNGTPWDWAIGKNGDNAPYDVCVPPTAGIKVLKANLLHVNQQLEKGYREEVTPIYFLPWPEYEKIVAVDIEGQEWSNYSRPMTESEKKQHGKPVLAASVSNDIRAIMEDQGIEIEQVKGKEVKLVKKEKKKDGAIGKQPPLGEDEKDELEARDEDAGSEEPEQKLRAGDINLL